MTFVRQYTEIPGESPTTEIPELYIYAERYSGHTGSQTGPKRSHHTHTTKWRAPQNLPPDYSRGKTEVVKRDARRPPTIEPTGNIEGEAHPAPQPGVRLRPLRFDSGDPPAPKPTGIRVHPEYTGGVGAPLGPPYPTAPLPVLMGKWEFSPRSQGQAPRKR
jgi:hypothetical protein